VTKSGVSALTLAARGYPCIPVFHDLSLGIGPTKRAQTRCRTNWRAYMLFSPFEAMRLQGSAAHILNPLLYDSR
jgi:hypothetical protein